VDLYTGHRTTIIRTVKDVTTKAGITTGTITIEHQDYTVRQVGKSNEWYFCDAHGQRIRKEFDKQNNDEKNFREKREKGE
jgi:CDGSH-type Zn-finger protein